MANVNARSAIGIDIGGTRIKAGRVTFTSQAGEAGAAPGVDAAERAAITARELLEVGDDRGEERIVARVCELLEALDPGGTLPVGVAAPGVFDIASGRIRESPNFPSWRDFALGARVSERTGRRIQLENDANAVIFGEAVAGAGRGVRDLVGYTLGTGVGGGIVLGGALWRGSRGMAGELGHVTVVPEGRPCGCGNRGCLEQYAGAVGIRASMRERGGELAALAESRSAPRALAERADAGDAGARAIYADVGAHLGVAIAALIHTLDVTLVLLCGGVAAAAPHYMPALEREVRARTFRTMSEGLRVRVGTLDTDAGVVGAAAVARSLTGA